MPDELHHRLKPLPDVLLQSLGRIGRLDKLATTLESAPHFSPPLRHADRGNLYTVNALLGLDLTVECIRPTAIESEQLWGLHSFTLRAGDWGYKWPEGLNPASATAHDVVALFDPDLECTVATSSMVCFTVAGIEAGQQWSVLCLFDAADHHLQSFSLVRVGDWIS